MRRVVVALLLTVSACGRVGFDRADAATGDSGDASALPFCAGKAQMTFCSDFSDGLDQWTPGPAPQYGSYIVDQTGGPTGGAALVVTTDPIATGNVDIQLFANLPTLTSSHVIVSYDVRVDASDISVPVFSVVNLDSATVLHGIEYTYHSPPNPSVIEETVRPMGMSTTYYFDSVTSFPVGEWHRVELDVQADALVVRASLDGVLTETFGLTDATSGTITVILGLPYMNSPTGAWAIRETNVVVDVK